MARSGERSSKGGDERERLFGWALERVRGRAAAKTEKRAKGEPWEAPALDAVGRRFALEPIERQIVAVAWAAARSAELARAARERSGGLTVELLREALGDEVDGALGPTRPLRQFALVAIDAPGY